MTETEARAAATEHIKGCAHGAKEWESSELSGPVKRVRMIIAPTIHELAARCDEWLMVVETGTK